MALFAKKKTEGLGKGPMDVVALDIGASGVKVIRGRRTREGFTVTGADILPRKGWFEAADGDGAIPESSRIPHPLAAKYAAVAYSSPRSVVRVVSLPGTGAMPEAEHVIRESAGLDARYRVAVLPQPSPRPKETRLLTVAQPQEEIDRILAGFPAGPPAVMSLEFSGLAAVNACVHGPARPSVGEAVCVIESGAQSTVIAMIHRESVVLVRKIDVGGDAIVQSLQKELEVDPDVARSILAGGSFDISGVAQRVMDPLIRQLVISRDFVERQEQCRFGVAFLSGGMSLSPSWAKELTRATGMEMRTWNPFLGLTVAGGAVPERLTGQETRFAAAVGLLAGLGARI